MASKGVNKVTLLGYLGTHPITRYLNNETLVTNISLATAESWKDNKTGEIREETEWHKVVLFGKPAEIADLYLRKGMQVYVEGRLRTHRWTNSDNTEISVTEIIVSRNGTLKILGSKTDHHSRDETTPVTDDD